MRGSIRVLIVDQHKMARRGLKALLNSVPEMTVIGAVGDGETAVQKTAHLHPDVVVLDLESVAPDYFLVVRGIKKASPVTRILILTNREEGIWVREALRSGVLGYWLKDGDLPAVITAIRDVAHGKLILHPGITYVLVEMLQCVWPVSKRDCFCQDVEHIGKLGSI
jgi:DNA-binding NarL/FixJ family response regulator